MARPEPDLSAHAPLLRALGDEGRLRIVARLAASAASDGAMCVCDLMTGIELSQPTVSHHLKVLKDAGVVRSERRGSWVYYSLELAILGSLGGLITALAPPLREASASETEPKPKTAC